LVFNRTRSGVPRPVPSTYDFSPPRGGALPIDRIGNVTSGAAVRAFASR
jgi:hypothetical protein